MSADFKCRSCGKVVKEVFVDLGVTPLANSYVPADRPDEDEPSFPLRAVVCENCFLVQLDHNVPADEIFTPDYAYFSSFSDSWLAHAKAYADAMISRFNLGPSSFVMEIASNDGYLLKNFVAKKIPVLGIDPAANTALAAEKVGVPTRVSFFGTDTAAKMASEGISADLIAANNVMAHVPNLSAFVGGFPLVLKENGVLTVEFPHLLRLIEGVHFDTIYHEHYSYLSLTAVEFALARAGMRVFDVDELSTHGGSLRIYACKKNSVHKEMPTVERIRSRERDVSLDQIEGYRGFNERVANCRAGFLEFLHKAKADGKRIAAYGAAAKGNTFLNYCGVGADVIDFVVDRSPAKQGRLLPGSHLPIMTPEQVDFAKPDFLVILPWNLAGEVMEQMSGIRAWGGRFVTAVPEVRIYS